jgi:hypothetical protein
MQSEIANICGFPSPTLLRAADSFVRGQAKAQHSGFRGKSAKQAGAAKVMTARQPPAFFPADAQDPACHARNHDLRHCCGSNTIRKMVVFFMKKPLASMFGWQKKEVMSFADYGASR